MNNEKTTISNKDIIDELADKIIKEFFFNNEITINSRYRDKIKKFISSEVSDTNKLKGLELIYLLKIYENGYIGPDPRGTISLKVTVFRLLDTKDDKEFNSKYKEAKRIVKLFETAATSPIKSTKKLLEDRVKYQGVKF